uniref:Acetyl-coenzyme A synthetase n=2 Tax=Dunaliella tertiolecta TaxID=3047 RepID=A0A6S8M2K9_DUNTE
MDMDIQSTADYEALYTESTTNGESFWNKHARALLFWSRPWSGPVCKANLDVRKGPVSISWFEGAQTNAAYNCVDRHVEAGHGDRVALFWEGNDPCHSVSVTYKQLQDRVYQITNYLTSIGVKQGDGVTIYMPMIPELCATMLACARIGAVHSVVFAGFSADALCGRILDSRPRVVITATGSKRGTKAIPLKGIVDEALALCEKAGHNVEVCLVYDHSLVMDRSSIHMRAGRDVWWQDTVAVQPCNQAPIVWVDAEHPLFQLYTSGSTGQPKGVLHTTGGYLVGTALTFKYVFDYQPSDVYWCTADCGWITGHSYLTYGPMLNMATQVIFEGVPTYPDPGRCWEIVDKYKVSIFYTAPTAVRALHAKGDEWVTRHSRASLRLLGSVGEPINPDAHRWYKDVVGGGRCPIMDTWWQTETGAHMIAPLPRAMQQKPGSAALPFFGVSPAIVDEKGNVLQGECEGHLVITQPWPSMMRTIAGDHARFEQTYFQVHPGMYFTGDGARRDAEGYYWIIGRVDDVINVSGHRIGTAEVENALEAHPAVAEAAVVPVDHAIKGQGMYAFITLMGTYSYPPEGSVQLKAELSSAVRKAIGAIASLDAVHWAPGLPKTRSGKILRRVLRKIAAGQEDQIGDTSTLADPSIMQTLISLRNA